jgi:hypothetical protein
VLVWLLLLTMTLVPQQRVRENRPIVPKGYTLLTGEALPEWLVWRNACRSLTEPIMAETLDVSPEQRELVVTVAKRVAAAEDTNRARQQRTLDEMTAAGKPWTEVKPVLKAIDLEHRILTLQERDALLERLTPEARLELERWAQRKRKTTESYVRTEDLEQYNLP